MISFKEVIKIKKMKIIFRSKEDFFNYLDDLFNSTFKITKYNKTDIEPNIKRNGDYEKFLLKLQRIFNHGNIKSAYELLKKSELDMTLLNDWSEKAGQSWLMLNKDKI